jgi:hypothetical protein
MLPDLQAWERTSPVAPQLIVISTGSVEINRAMGLQAPVLLDRDGHVSRAYGATGTPSAVLVDPQNKVASPVTFGADAVLALARTSAPAASL